MIGSVRLAEVAAAINAKHRGTNVPFQSVSTDTRTIQSGDLFVALVGDRFDGHEYLQEAADKGASAVMISREVESPVPYLQVKDTLTGLADLAKFNRDRFQHPLVAVTGSSGKTTVKEMVAHVLRSKAGASEVLATRGNFNNHIGAPLTLLRLTQQHHYAVIELGASAEGEIAYTAKLAQPSVSILTNADAAHLEGFGDIDTVARTKGEIIDHLVDGGTAILNADSKYFSQWVERAEGAGKKVISFGLNNQADVHARNVQSDEHGCHSFEAVTPKGNFEFKLSIMGKHNVTNALTATATCLALDISPEVVAKALVNFFGVKGRLAVQKGTNDSTIIDDSYNANPASVRAAIDALATHAGTRIFVLGDMAELGADTQRAHAEMGAYAREAGIDAFYGLGEFSRSAVDAFGDNGHWFATHETLVRFLTKNLNTEVTALVKGSRSANMDRVVADITISNKD